MAFNITEVLTQDIRCQQIYIYIGTTLACLRDSQTYMTQVAIHTMDYVDAASAKYIVTAHNPCGRPEKY